MPFRIGQVAGIEFELGGPAERIRIVGIQFHRLRIGNQSGFRIANAGDCAKVAIGLGRLFVVLLGLRFLRPRDVTQQRYGFVGLALLQQQQGLGVFRVGGRARDDGFQRFGQRGGLRRADWGVLADDGFDLGDGFVAGGDGRFLLVRHEFPISRSGQRRCQRDRCQPPPYQPHAVLAPLPTDDQIGR